MARVLGIDVGERKIGLAIGDTETKLAFARPALLVENWDTAWPELAGLVSTEGIVTIIVGWPLNTSGTVGPQAERVNEFIDLASHHLNVPILKRDERHTSQAVQREQSMVRRKLPRGAEDSLAAQLLVESYLTEIS